MERGQVVIFAVVVAALALFGLKVWSDRANEDHLTSGGRVVGDLARLDDQRGGDRDALDDSGGSARPGRGPGRLGDRNPLRQGSAGAGGRGSGDRSGGTYGAGGAAVAGGRAGDEARGFGSRVGSSGGSAGVAGGGSGGSGGSIVGPEGGKLGPKAQKKNDLVDFLSSQPATQPELAKPEGDGEVALKLESTQDISKQGGLDKEVTDQDNGIEIPENGQIQFPNNVSPDAATFEFNIEPKWSGSDQTDNALVELRGEHDWSNRLELVKNGEFLRFILTDNTGKESDISARISDWQAGDPHDIRASYGPCADGGSNCTYLYIDGRLAGTNTYPGQFQPPLNTPLFVGGDHKTSNYQGAGATFRGFTIKNTAQ
jgi:hypothetical protein